MKKRCNEKRGFKKGLSEFGSCSGCQDRNNGGRKLCQTREGPAQRGGYTAVRWLCVMECVPVLLLTADTSLQSIHTSWVDKPQNTLLVLEGKTVFTGGSRLIRRWIYNPNSWPIQETASQSPQCYSACLIRNVLNWKEFVLVLVVLIKRDPPVHEPESGLCVLKSDSGFRVF